MSSMSGRRAGPAHPVHGPEDGAWASLPALAQMRIVAMLPEHAVPTIRLVCRELRALADMHISHMTLRSSELEQHGMQQAAGAGAGGAAPHAALGAHQHGAALAALALLGNQQGGLAAQVQPPPWAAPPALGPAAGGGADDVAAAVAEAAIMPAAAHEAGAGPSAQEGQQQQQQQQQQLITEAEAALLQAQPFARAVTAWARSMRHLTVTGANPQFHLPAASPINALPLLPPLASRLRQLQRLTLQHLNPLPATIRTLAAVAPTSLSRIDLLAPQLCLWPVPVWAALASLPSLSHLSLASWYFSGDTGAGLSQLSQLRSLSINRCNNEGEGLGVVSCLTRLTRWAYSNISYAHGIHQEFVGVSALKGLRELEAEECDFFPDEVSVWSGLRTSLTSLSLSSQFQLTLDTVAVTVPRITSLVVLQVPDVLLTAQLLAALRAGTPRLARLRVAWVNISAADVAHYGRPLSAELEVGVRESELQEQVDDEVQKQVQKQMQLQEWLEGSTTDAQLQGLSPTSRRRRQSDRGSSGGSSGGSGGAGGQLAAGSLGSGGVQGLVRRVAQAVVDVFIEPLARDAAHDALARVHCAGSLILHTPDTPSPPSATTSTPTQPAGSSSSSSPGTGSTSSGVAHSGSAATATATASTAAAAATAAAAGTSGAAASGPVVAPGCAAAAHAAAPAGVSQATPHSRGPVRPPPGANLTVEQLADRALRQLRAQLATRVRSELDRIGYVHRLQAITNSDPQQLDAAVREAVGPAVSRLGPRMRELVMQAQERLSCHRRAQAALALPLLAHLSLSHAYSQQHTCKLPLSHLFPTLVSLEVGRVSTQFDLFGHGVNNWEWRELLGSWPPGLQAPRVLHRAPLRVVQDAALDAEMLRWSGLPEVLPATSSLSVLCEDRNTRVQPPPEAVRWLSHLRRLLLDRCFLLLEGLPTAALPHLAELVLVDCVGVDARSLAHVPRTMPHLHTLRLMWCSLVNTELDVGMWGATAYTSAGAGVFTSFGRPQLSARPFGMLSPLAGHATQSWWEDGLGSSAPGLKWLQQLALRLPELQVLHVVGCPALMPSMRHAAWLQRAVDQARTQQGQGAGMPGTSGATAVAAGPTAAGSPSARFDVEWCGGGDERAGGGEVHREHVRAHLARTRVALPDGVRWNMGLGF